MHVFFGYYDLMQISTDGRRLAAHAVGKNAHTARHIAQIGYFDLPGGEYHTVAGTRAWCWQQGARLRWHPQDSNKLLYNDINNDMFVTKAADISHPGKEDPYSVISKHALYDISNDFKYGVSVNFARLQRLRPGYGYSTLPDKTAGDSAPEDDGVFLVDLSDNTASLVVSLKKLALALAPGSGKDLEYEHYINHVSFSPGGRKFIFFHVYISGKSSNDRRVRLYLYNIDNGGLELVEDDWRTSHYAWRGADELLITASKDGAVKYTICNLAANTKQDITHSGMKQDGHPSFFRGGSEIVTDLYFSSSMQKLFMYDFSGDAIIPLSEFYYFPVTDREMRCDLHPRVWEGGGRRVVTVDTTCKDAVRKVAMLELKN